MHYIILFQDNPDAPADLRTRHMAAHLDFLAAHREQIKAAGPAFAAGKASGGIWHVTAQTEQEVEDLIRSDPFWPTGLRATHQILEWRRVFADGARQ